MFEEMKSFEVLLESLWQLDLNVLLIVRGINKGYVAYISVTFSALSLLYGVFQQTEAKDQEEIKQIKFPGRLLVTLLIIRLPLSLTFGDPIMFEHEHIILDIIMMCIPIVHAADEILTLIFAQTRTIAHDQGNRLQRTRFILLQPTFVDLRRSKLYLIPYIFAKLIPNIVILVFTLSWCIREELFLYVSGEPGDGYLSILLDRILFVYSFLIIQTLLTVLYTLYLCKQDWFFIPASHEEDDVEADGAELERLGDEGDKDEDTEAAGVVGNPLQQENSVESQFHDETRSLGNHSKV